MINSIVKWFNALLCVLALSVYIFTKQENETLGILAIMAFLMFRYCDDEEKEKKK